MKRIPLKTLPDCRRYLAGLINRIENGLADASEGSKKAYIINILIKIIENGDLERRIEALEQGGGTKCKI
jgi:hypothetical protein